MPGMGGHAAPRVGSRLGSAARPAVNPPRPSGERTCKCGAIYARFSFESSKSELRRGCLRRAQQPQQHLQAAQQQRSANHTRTSGAAVSAQMSSLHNKHRMLTCRCRGALRASGAKRKLLPFGHGRSTLEETRGKSGHLRALCAFGRAMRRCDRSTLTCSRSKPARAAERSRSPAGRSGRHWRRTRRAAQRPPAHLIAAQPPLSASAGAQCSGRTCRAAALGRAAAFSAASREVE